MSDQVAPAEWFDAASLGGVARGFLSVFQPPEQPYYFASFVKGVREAAQALSPSRTVEFSGQAISTILDRLETDLPVELQRVKPQWSQDSLRGTGISPYRSFLLAATPESAAGYRTLKALLLGLLLVRHADTRAASKEIIEATSRFIRLASVDVHISFEYERRAIVSSLPDTFAPSTMTAVLDRKEGIPSDLHPRLDELSAAVRKLAQGFRLIFKQREPPLPTQPSTSGVPPTKTRDRSKTKNSPDDGHWALIETSNDDGRKVDCLFGALRPSRSWEQIAADAETADDHSSEIEITLIECEAFLSQTERYEVAVRHRPDVRQGFWSRYQWDALSPAEMRQAITLLLDESNDSDASAKSVRHEAIALGLMTAGTGLPLTRCHAIKVGTASVMDRGEFLDRDSGVLYVPIPSSESRYSPTPEQVPLLQHVSDICPLALPLEVFESTRALVADANGYLFRTDLDALENILREIFAEARADEPRLTTARLCRGHQLGVLATCGDVAMAQVITGQNLGTPTTPLAYYTARPEKIQETYNSAIKAHGFTPRDSTTTLPSYPVGSRLILTQAAHAAMVKVVCKGVANKPRASRSTGRALMELHDDMVRATVSLWMSATGFRPTFRIGLIRATMIDWWSSYAVIADKVSDDGHEGRLVPLAPVLMQSLGAYGWLLDSMSTDRRLTRRIRKAAIDALNGRGPLFFVATPDGVRPLVPSDLESRLPLGWNIPTNFRRHRLATRLREVGCSGIYIQALIGHHELGIQPHGTESFQNPAEYLVHSRECVERVLREDGWRPLLGGAGSIEFFQRAVQPVGTDVLRLESAFERRAQDRFRQQRSSVRELQKLEGARISTDVLKVVGQLHPLLLSQPTAAHELEKDAVTDLRRAVCQSADNLAEIETRVIELRNLLRNGRAEYGWKVRFLPHFFTARSQPSTHLPEMVESNRAVVRLRERFADILMRAQRASSAEGGILNCVLALILWHGVSSWERLEQILKGLPHAEMLGPHGLALAIPIEVFRHESDPEPTASAEVLFGPVALAASRLQRLTTEWSRDAINALVFDWVPREIVRCEAQLMLDVLFSLGRVALRFDAPGPLRAVWTGEYTAVGMPIDRLRALFGTYRPRSSDTSTRNFSECQLPVTKLAPGRSKRLYSWLKGTLRVACGYRNEFPILGEIDGSSIGTGKSTHQRIPISAKPHKRRMSTIDRLGSALNQWPQDGSLIRSLTAYALDRLENGTPWSTEIEPASVYSYVTAVGSGLLRHDPNFLLADHDAESYSEIYTTCIDLATWKYRHKLTNYFAYFHGYLVDHRLAPPVAIGSRRSQNRSLPEVGYIAPNEIAECERYLAQLKSSHEDRVGTSTDIESALVALTLGFAAGSRTSETLLRETRELVTAPGRRALLIRRNRWVGVKTFCSSRIVDLEPYMPDDAWRRIMQWQSDSAALRRPKEQRNSALLSGEVDGRVPPATEPIVRLVGATLRAVTGRPDARPYWGRHTSASNDALALFATENVHTAIREAVSADRLDWVPHPLRVREALGGPSPLGQSHAAGFRSRRGHASMRTPCETYVHTWHLIEPWTSRQAGSGLTSNALASLVGTHPATLRKRLSRASIATTEQQVAMQHLLKLDHLEANDSNNQASANVGNLAQVESIQPHRIVEALHRALKRGDVAAISRSLHLTPTATSQLIRQLVRFEAENAFGLNLGLDFGSTPRDDNDLIARRSRSSPMAFGRLNLPWIRECIARRTGDTNIAKVWQIVGRGLDPQSGSIHVADEDDLKVLTDGLRTAIHSASHDIEVHAVIDPTLFSGKTVDWKARMDASGIRCVAATTRPPPEWGRISFCVISSKSGNRSIAALAMLALTSFLLEVTEPQAAPGQKVSRAHSRG